MVTRGHFVCGDDGGDGGDGDDCASPAHHTRRVVWYKRRLHSVYR